MKHFKTSPQPPTFCPILFEGGRSPTERRTSPNFGEGVRKRRAFTLVELLVVIAIIGLLSTVAVVALNPSRVNARNTKRKADLVQISKALELYYADNAAYPSTNDERHGFCDYFGSYPDTGAGAWIPNFSAYMPQLPHDPNTNKKNPNNAEGWCRDNVEGNCYVYRSSGTDYKVWAYCVPEGAISTSDPFADPVRNYTYQISSPGANGW